MSLMKKKKSIVKSNLFRIICAVIIMILLFRMVDVTKLRYLFKEIDMSWVWLSCLLIILLRIIMAVRLQFILKVNKVNLSLKEIINVTFISMFFGYIFPGSAGADVVKGYQLFKSHGHGYVITGSIIFDRFIGLYSMLFLAFIGSVIAIFIGISLKIAVLIAILQIFITVVWLFFCYLVNKKRLFHFNSNGKYSKLWSRVRMILTVVTNVKMIKRVFPFLFSISLLTQLSRCAFFFCLYKSFGSSLNFIYFLIFIPIIFIILILPISVGGLGIREASLVFFFKSIGITNEISLSAGVLSHFLHIVISLPFIIPLLSDVIKVKRKKEK
jgi:glycosyltransferase 2 family protein